MTNLALKHLQVKQENAGDELAQVILARLQEHLTACSAQGALTPFSITVNIDTLDDVTARALELCTVWTDRNGNAVTADYVWMDSGDPDLIRQVQNLAVLGVAGSIGLAAAAVAGAFIPVLGPMIALETAGALLALEKPHTRYIVFAPSSIRAKLRLPVRVYNIMGGHVAMTAETVGSLVIAARDAVVALPGAGRDAIKGLRRKPE